ncbi:pleckstrin-like [Physella acuta]|uniref:pleckstrin-like n=1 Tax=Physella acuta TaxID=109671 RepID=UPI0027DBB462|nr:pleckstrin-like [Physella acuta]
MNPHHILKEGYLLVQNSNRKWKARWFVLSEDELSCQHKKNKSITINSLPLQGASVISPCPHIQDYNTQGLLKLHLPDGEELYFQAGGVEDRDRWAHALGAVIRSLSTSKEIIHDKMAFQDFHTFANVSEIIGAIQDPDAGIESANHLRGGVVFKNCFTGKAIVDWLLRWSLVRNRGNGSAMGQALLKLGHVQEVDLKDGTSGISPRFNDNDKLYRFTSINLGAKRNSFYDSTDSDSSSSEDEDDDVDKEEQKMKKGKALKDAFLAKKKHIRKGWRVMKVIVRESPPSLQYYRAKYAAITTEEKFPTKTFLLDSCKVMEIIKPPSSKGSSSTSSGTSQGTMCPRFRLVIRSKKGKTLTFQMKDEQEKVEWLGVLSDLCSKTGGGDVCSKIGGGDVCSKIGGGDVCSKIGGGDVCSKTGGGDVCSKTGGGDVCSKTGGGDVCSKTGGGDVCSKTGGGDVCSKTGGGDAAGAST